MFAEPGKSPGNGGDGPKLRAACENCRQSKVKCNLGGKNTCIRCNRHGLQCRYRIANRSGKPKGSKNRATLRKLGQLQETTAMRAPGRGTESKHRSLQATDLPSTDQELDKSGNETREPSQHLTDSPLSQTSTANTCMLLGEPPADYIASYRDPLPDLTHAASMSPTFLQKEFITKGLTSFPLAVHIPNILQPVCDCCETIEFHANRLQHMATDAIHMRFDQGLQTVKAALSVCRGFFQCRSCHKDNTHVLLCVTTVGLALQLFDYWISYQCATSTDGVGYGEYELAPDEMRRVRRVLIRSRLQQCKEVVTSLKETIVMFSHADLEGSWLQQIIQGYEGTTSKMAHRLNQLTSHLNYPHGLLANQVAIITGGGQGIGAETARLFANEGAKVVIADIDARKATNTANAINAVAPNRALAVTGDILDDKYIEELVRKAAEFGNGKIHVIVNNAGFTWDGVIHKITDKQWDTMLAVHNTAPFKLVRAAAKYFRVKDGEPRVIINISSTSGIHGNAGQANYALAKAGLVGLTKTIAKEWGPAYGVRANTVAFGFVQTRLTAAKEDGAFITTPDGTKVALGIPGKQLDARKAGNGEQKQAYPDIPLGRGATPEEAAKSVLAVASPLFSYVTGETIRVTGGRNM
ncbi:3-oxoacyl-reductase [Aspergillus alliaceus]|uniref:3-oxoacyl-reductase n=1 Tax=Petromyces alliaceus TaxID=209559 RepID=UPI0012A66F89|nr:3-oxoacyl-reductase [Aspergillus alliaceus]KAB8228602.1 3-oxoacyl-reductase [Aspergillus alliaceus]